MAGHIFVDETKERCYLLVAAVVPDIGLATARQAIRRLILPRQRRLHFTNESNARRGEIVDAIRGLNAGVVIDDGSGAPDKQARRACLAELVADAGKDAAHRIVIELDESVVEFDKRLLFERVRAAGVADTLRYDHMRARDECLLAVPDAVAWCWAKGGHWRARVRPMITEIRRVRP